jgi:dipeptidyl aminopeptidase/acylaminoacyl peptidase
MTRFFAFTLILVFTMNSCDGPVEQSVEGDYSGQLTTQEIDGGILTPEILWKFGRLGDMQLSPDGTTVIYNVTRYDAQTNRSITNIFKVPSRLGDAAAITNYDGKYLNPRWKPDGSGIGFLFNGDGSYQIWEMGSDGGSISQVSNEDGDINSFEYSPDGNHILFTMDVLVDQTTLDVYPDLPLANVRIIEDLMYRHWNDWHNYQYSHIFVSSYLDGSLGEVIDIMKDEPWDAPLSPYFDGGEISWTPDGKAIAYTCKKMKGRDYAISTNSDIYLYNLESGMTRNLTEGMPGYEKYPSFSNDGKQMAFMSMETPGYEADKERLFVLDMESGVKRYLTRDWDRNASSFTWSGDNSSIYFIGGLNATYQVCKIDLETLEVKQITSGRQSYRSIALNGDILLGTKTSSSLATEIFRINLQDGSEAALTGENDYLYKNIKLGRVEERWIKTSDKKDMLTWVFYPPDFDPERKYPAILFCGGGPQNAVGTSFSYRWNYQLMAANGYIVVAPNRRGVPTFGREWCRQISGDYGGQNMQDYLSAIDALAKEEFVDADRLGAIGASYGGYSVFYLAGMHEGRFKTFISHCGVYNFESMYTETEETFFPNFDYEGAYWENPKPKSYDYSPHLYVQNWDTPIMIIVGENDMRIPYTQSMEAFNAAQLRGVPSKLLYFPDESHWVLKAQNSILWQREFFNWLDKYLKNS